jgi:hypothetical protein
MARKRQKVSATLPLELVDRVNLFKEEFQLPNFSAALEQLIGRAILEEATKNYYLSLSGEEIAEEKAWASFSTTQAAKVFSREE